jgi:hypothetical protein
VAQKTERSAVGPYIQLVPPNARFGSFEHLQRPQVPPKQNRSCDPCSVLPALCYRNSRMHASHAQIQPPSPTSSNRNHIELPVIQAKPTYPSGVTELHQHIHFVENNHVSIAARSSTPVWSHVMREEVRHVPAGAGMLTSQVSGYCKDRSQEINPENETRKIRLDMLSDHHSRLCPQRDKK